MAATSTAPDLLAGGSGDGHGRQAEKSRSRPASYGPARSGFSTHPQHHVRSGITMALFGLIGNDKKLAQDYSGPSASEMAARKRRARYHRTGATKAARQGQAWEDAERARQDRGGWWSTR
ncbi:hypothetical protein [Streptomyces sp. ITFR-6]|uniref:hypothetical protein n=1 Tax=Streptomyces sp. ITFR-6 TaxID=3075197 RepID=UPI00288B9A78|nr:hypothetical protein [Streptomyces sp. ITFR-6]WNI34401.1 hypothetical protein RLT59_37925 [Streptomyces sp. ITFR-6]